MGNSITKHTEPRLQFRNGKFVNTTKKQMTCSLCDKWLVKPVQSTNGHRFCEVCFMQISESGGCFRCKEDGISLQEDCGKLAQSQFFSDKGVVIDRKKMKAICMDCGYKGTCGDMKSHENHCARHSFCM